jgi:hypothetical protein
VYRYEPHDTQAFSAMAFDHMVAMQIVKLPTGWDKPLTSHISQELNTDSNNRASTTFLKLARQLQVVSPEDRGEFLPSFNDTARQLRNF